jgi:hypothetical protein
MEAPWRGPGGVVHAGSFAGDAAPNGNHVHLVDDDAGWCTVDVTLVG